MTLVDPSFTNRRRYPRHATAAPVALRRWSRADDVALRGYVRDIAVAGCCVEVHGLSEDWRARAQQSATVVPIRLELGVPWLGRLRRVAARVVWSRPVAGGDPEHYRFGVSFVELPGWRHRYMLWALVGLRAWSRWFITLVLVALLATLALAAWDAGRYESWRYTQPRPTIPRLFVR